jgi:translation initiation factor 2 beta subunit (eIF-2beta)/eIF-5
MENLNIIVDEMENLLSKIKFYNMVMEAKYNGKLRDMELINGVNAYMDELVVLIKRIDEIEINAIKNGDDELMFKCEHHKSVVINAMEELNEIYF